ncbi:MAG: prefoldin subunit [Candidatus Micrarchaeia archaeon]
MPEQPTTGQDAEKLIKDYQLLQEQLRIAAMQADQLKLQQGELATAEAEVSKATGKVYVTIGGIIVESDKEAALKNISERKENNEIRLQSVNKQIAELRSREKQLRDKISQLK